jgi:hypothetical protein
MDLMQALGGNAGIASIARELGMNEQQVQAGAAALLPAVLGGFKKQATGGGGLEGLMGMIGGMGGGGLLDSVLAPQATPVDQGNAVLGQIFGDKEVSRSVAGQAAAQTGLDPSLLKKMLPMLAMAAAGFMAKQASAGGAGAQQGGLGGLIGQVIGGLTGGGQPAAPQGGMAGLAGLLDLDGDGNPLDDILGMASKMAR